MTDSYRQQIQAAIDDAISVVAQEQWFRLAGNMQSVDDRVYAAWSVQKSFESLGRLKQDRGIPDYDEWDALFYLTWYQPEQIHLAYDLLKRFEVNWAIEKKSGWNGDVFGFRNGNVRILDYGCGALAMKFAISLVATDAITKGVRISNICIDSIDRSPAMIRIGQRVWYTFADIIRHRDQDNPICSIIDRTVNNCHINYDTLKESVPDVPCFITAIHCSYTENAKETKSVLAKLTDRYNPVGVFLTNYWSRSDVLFDVSPGEDDQRYELVNMIRKNHNPCFIGELEKTMKWRTTLLDRLLGQEKLLVDKDVDFGLLRNYLRSYVKWNIKKYATLVYIRRDVEVCPFNPIQVLPKSIDDLPF